MGTTVGLHGITKQQKLHRGGGRNETDTGNNSDNGDADSDCGRCSDNGGAASGLSVRKELFVVTYAFEKKAQKALKTTRRMEVAIPQVYLQDDNSVSGAGITSTHTCCNTITSILPSSLPVSPRGPSGQNNDCDGSAHGSSSMNAAYPQSSRTSNDHTSASAVGCTVEHNACVWRPLDIKSSLAANFNRVRYQGGQNYIIADKMLVMHQRES
eukprot:3231-Heterococcus_DN1.PRE.2